MSSRPTPRDPAERETEEEWRDPAECILCHARYKVFSQSCLCCYALPGAQRVYYKFCENVNPRWQDLADNWGRKMRFRGQNLGRTP